MTKKASADFVIEGLEVPGKSAPVIQSWVIVPHLNAALLMISGGDRATWPRPGNRPIYYWISFRTGACRAMPTGWDLEYFSADQSVAVFDNGPATAAIDVKTGERTDRMIDRRRDSWAPFDWSHTALAQPLQTPSYRFTGISMNGRPHPFRLSLASPHVFSVRVRDAWVAFHLRGHGSPRKDLWTLWFSPLEKDARPKRLSDNVRDFEILATGRCVYAARGHGPKGASTEAYVYDAKTLKLWNVLNGVERLPELPIAVAKKSYVRDDMRVRLAAGFGRSRGRQLVLALFTHSRTDERASLILGNDDNLRVERKVWRRAILLTSTGQRYDVRALPKQVFSANHIWMHNSGKLVWGESEWRNEGGRRVPKVRLSLIVARHSVP